MDPFGLIGLIGLAGQVLNSMIQLGLDMKDAPSEARDFVRQLQVLKTAISETNTNLVLNSDFREAFQGRHSTILSELDSTTELTDTQSMVSACVDELKAMIETLKKRSQNKINWTRIKSGFVAQKTKDAVDNLERQCRILNSLVAIDAVVLNARTFNTVQLIRKEQQKTLESVEKIHDRLDAQRNAEEQKAIFDWLSSADYVTQHHDQISKRQPGTGTWFLESHEYNVWLTQNQGTLFCPGIPGAGKTILSATLIDHLLESYKGDLDIGVGYLYCNYQRQETQKADDLLAALLKQLCQRVDLIPHSLAALYDDFKDKSRPPFVGVSKCLQSAISAYSQVFVVIDALDECNEFEREKFLTELRNIQESSHLNLFATSRFTGDIISHFEGCSTLEVRARRGDIEMYLDQNMKKLKSFVQRNPKLQEDIKESISTAADGMFLLASLYFNSMIGMTTVKKLKNALVQIQQQTKSAGGEQQIKRLHNVYSNTIDRIIHQHPESKDDALQVLAWVTFAKRPLTVLELRHALAVEVGEPEFDEDNISDLDDIISICAGLITVDEASSIIRLSHYTAQEYLSQTKDQWLPDAEAEMAVRCVSYLNMDGFEPCTDEDLPQRLEDYPLYEYAALNWGYHAQGSLGSCDGICDFLQDIPKVVAAAQEIMHEMSARYPWFVSIAGGGATGLHLAAWFGLVEVFDLPWASGLVEAKDDQGSTPMLWAAENGQHEAIERLLKKGAEADYENEWGLTPLQAAVERGHLAIVEVLLASGKAQVDFRSVSLASEHGHEAVAALLVKAGGNSEFADKDGQTPLFLAAEGGHEAVVKMLLATGQVNPDTPTTRRSWPGTGRTALYVAVRYGHVSVVEMLLKYGVSTSWRIRHSVAWFGKGPVGMINGRAFDGGFVHQDVDALYLAASWGHQPVVRLLLEHGVPVNQLFTETTIMLEMKYSQDSESGALCRSLSPTVKAVKKTALSIAIEKGYSAIIQQLQSRGGIETNTIEEAHLIPDSLKFSEEGATYVEMVGDEAIHRTVAYLE